MVDGPEVSFRRRFLRPLHEPASGLRIVLGFLLATAAPAVAVGVVLGAAAHDVPGWVRLMAVVGSATALLAALPIFLLARRFLAPRIWWVVPLAALAGAAPWLAIGPFSIHNLPFVMLGTACGGGGGMVFWAVVRGNWLLRP